MITDEKLKSVIDSICNFLDTQLNIEANSSTCLLGKESTIDSLTVIKLVAWCEDAYCIENLLDDDLSLDSLSSVMTLSEKVLSKMELY